MTEQTLMTKTDSDLATKTLTPVFMKEIGISESELPEVTKMADSLKDLTISDVNQWGQDAAEHTVGYADQMLEMVTTSDLDETGKQLTDVLSHAKRINVSGLSFERSRVPVVGALIDKFRVRFSGALAQFKDAREAIDETAKEIKTTQANLQQRIDSLETAYEKVGEEYRILGRYIAASKLGIAQLDEEIAALKQDAGDAMSVQRISDMEGKRTQLEKRLANFTVLQQNAINTRPAIRLVQQNNAMLIEKYHQITSLTIPTWKRSMMLGLALEEQAQAVELAENIDNFTNQMMRDQAKMLKQNTLKTAAANQRLVIDVDTITFVQKELIDTVSGVIDIQSKARQEHEAAMKTIMDGRKQFQARLLSKENEAKSVH